MRLPNWSTRPNTRSKKKRLGTQAPARGHQKEICKFRSLGWGSVCLALGCSYHLGELFGGCFVSCAHCLLFNIRVRTTNIPEHIHFETCNETSSSVFKACFLFFGVSKHFSFPFRGAFALRLLRHKPLSRQAARCPPGWQLLRPGSPMIHSCLDEPGASVASSESSDPQNSSVRALTSFYRT